MDQGAGPPWACLAALEKVPNSQEVDLWRRFFFDDVGYNPCCSIYFMSGSTREVARFICVLGEYLREEVLRMQINPESLTRPSAPAMVGGRCHDDYQQGRVVELLSSEGSSSVQGGDGGELGKLAASRKVGHQGVWGSCPRWTPQPTAALS